ncbi:hypothetical protein BC833DRAFT_576323 [Globomyces pollinis-pini]|nr:hypothetical protein BC833DRAFT_576323 [Globomyces pollinis-pini]
MNYFRFGIKPTFKFRHFTIQVKPRSVPKVSIVPTIAGLMVGVAGFGLLNHLKVEAAPTYHGVPIAGTLLIFQGTNVFRNAFPGLEIVGVYSPGQDCHTYKEEGGVFGFYPNSAEAGLMVQEVLPKAEQKRLGAALLKQDPCGFLVLRGQCKFGCASVTLSEMKLYKLDSDLKPDFNQLVWKWSSSD